MKKIISIFMIIVLITCSYSFLVTRAATLGEQRDEIQEKKDEAQEKLEYVQEELSATVVKIQELDDKIKESEKDIENLENELSNLQVQIDEITQKLEKTQLSYDENEDLLKRRIVIMYEIGETTYLDILLKSSNIIEFISNYYFIQEIIRSDS